MPEKLKINLCSVISGEILKGNELNCPKDLIRTVCVEDKEEEKKKINKGKRAPFTHEKQEQETEGIKEDKKHRQAKPLARK